MPGSLVRIRSKDPRYPEPLGETLAGGDVIVLEPDSIGMVISFIDRVSSAVVLTAGQKVRVHYSYIEDLP